MERDRRHRRKMLLARLKVAAVAALVLLAVWGVVSLYRSQLFAVKRIDVIGNARLSVADVLGLAKVPAGSTLLRFPGGAVASRVAASPWVAKVSVTRDFPDTMRIRVTERRPAAIVDDGKASLWLVDSSGLVIAKRTAEDTGSLVVIRDVQKLTPRPGAVSDAEGLRNALGVLAGLSPELRSRIRAVSAPEVDKTALITSDNVVILIGSAEDLEKKDAIVRRILAEQAGRLVEINVRSVDRPSYKGVPLRQ